LAFVSAAAVPCPVWELVGALRQVDVGAYYVQPNYRMKLTRLGRRFAPRKDNLPCPG